MSFKVLSTAGMSDEGVYGGLISLGTLVRKEREEAELSINFWLLIIIIIMIEWLL